MKRRNLILNAFIYNLLIIEICFSLPVELASFTSSVNNNIVTLDWQTVMETNNNGFYIERKDINSVNWNQLGFVTGNGTTNMPHTYQYIDTVLILGSYNYRLKQVDFANSFQYFELSNIVIVNTVSASNKNSVVSEKFELYQNYPNPFNPVTKINYELPARLARQASRGEHSANFVTLKIFDILGNEISTLVNKKQNAGRYEVIFDASNIPSGIYFYKLETENFTKIKRMSFIK